MTASSRRIGPATRDDLTQTWNDGLAVVFTALEALTPADLDKTITIRKEPMSVVAALERSVTHLAYHVGQIVYLVAALRVCGGQMDVAHDPEGARNEDLRFATVASRPSRLLSPPSRGSSNGRVGDSRRRRITPDIPAKFAAPTERLRLRQARRDDSDAGRRQALHRDRRAEGRAQRADAADADAVQRRRSRRSATRSPHMVATLPLFDELFAADGYIRVYQDIRGKYGSEGEYVMTRPLRGPLNPSTVDHSTDAYDTIDWLVKNVPESNGRVGMIGSSYEGFTVVMALINPHPALKAAVPESPMVDGWMGDDWFHYGAFRQTNLDYFTSRRRRPGSRRSVVREGYDDYENFRRAGSAGDFAKAAGLDQLPWWRKIAEHPAYDAFWQEQALDKIDGGAAADRADDVAAGALGSGRHVGRDPQLRWRSSRRTPATTRTSW